jgi:hypothetical protein
MGVSGRWERFRDAFAPWAGLAAATLGGAFAHQVGSQGVFDECNSSPGLVLVVCLIGIAIAGAGALESWGVFRSSGEGPARKLVAAVSLATVALVAFAIILPIVASLVIPACYA